MFGHIGLIENHHRTGAAFKRQYQVALQPAGVVIAIQSHDDEDGIDVGGDDLLFGGLAGDLARKAAAPWQHHLDGRRGFARRRPGRDPIAHCRELLAALRFVPQLAGMLRLQFAGLRVEPVDVIELDGDAGGNQAVGGERRKAARPRLVPPQLLQIERHSRLG